MTTAVQPLEQQTTDEVRIRRQLSVITADTIVPDMTLHMLPKIAQHRRTTPHPQRPQTLVERLKLVMEPLAFRSPTNDKIPSTATMHIVREAQNM